MTTGGIAFLDRWIPNNIHLSARAEASLWLSSRMTFADASLLGMP